MEINTNRIHLFTTWFVLLGICQFTYAQKIGRGEVNELFPAITRYSPVLDSSINVAKLSLPARNKLIEKLYEVDQMYRAPLHKPGLTAGSDEEKRYNNLLFINDPVNQAILLKILKLDGWPCDITKREKSLSFMAWYIVWHNRDSYEGLLRFYPYLKVANKSNCILENQFIQVYDLLKHMRSIRGVATTD